MARSSSPFRQIDVTRVLRAASRAGVAFSRAEVDPQTGRIVLVMHGNHEAQAQAADREENEWDEVFEAPRSS